jgi:hypothetical protein
MYSKPFMPRLAGFAMVEISGEMYERLRRILEKQNGRTYTFEEAKEIGNEYIAFLLLLLKVDDQHIN